MTSRRGRLIVLEGIDGSGKSTLADSLVERWTGQGRRVVRWHEPTDPALGARGAVADEDDPRRAAMLFTLDRTIARPELEARLAKGDVIADRSFYSTLAYQGSRLNPADRRALDVLERAVAVVPDLVVFLDLAPSEALRRVGRRGGARSPLERLATLRRVAAAYRSYARKERWVVLDARQAAGELVNLADRAVAARLGPSARRRL
ncbi:MAG: dTMP kinase [Thermoplasmata archaeon]|jgi:dTMP kinase|nr:dTMP kinase [Thermoplasmata archaeon]